MKGLKKYMQEKSVSAKTANNKTHSLAVISLFAIFTAVCSQISFPLPFTPVPVNLALFSVLMSGAILGGAKGAVSQLVYVSLGVIGLPVFANLQAGAGTAIGPTGGFIAGYILASFIAGASNKSKRPFVTALLSMSAGTAACYLLGTAWFVFLTNTSISKSLLMCVLPFIPGDIFKIILASVFAQRLKAVYSAKRG